MIGNIYFVDSAANSLQLGQASTSYVLNHEGLEFLPISHWLQDIPFQDRKLHLGRTFKKRTILLQVWAMRASQIAMRTEWQNILDVLNPNLGEGYLRIILEDGTERRIDCRVNNGPEVDRMFRDDCVRLYVVEFEAANPFLYDPTQKSAAGTCGGGAIVCNNEGHVPVFPTVIIITPATNPVLTLGSEKIEITYNLAANHIDVDCEAPTVMYNDVTSLMQYISTDSIFFDLAQGNNNVTPTSDAGGGVVTVYWYNSYLGC